LSFDTTRAGRVVQSWQVGFDSWSRHIPKTCKTVLAACAASYQELVGGCKERFTRGAAPVQHSLLQTLLQHIIKGGLQSSKYGRQLLLSAKTVLSAISNLRRKAGQPSRQQPRGPLLRQAELGAGGESGHSERSKKDGSFSRLVYG